MSVAESYNAGSHNRRNRSHISRNLSRIREAISSSPDFFNRPITGYGLRWPSQASDSFIAIQITLTYLALDLQLAFRALRTDYDVAVVYGYGSTAIPIVSQDEVKLEQILHIRNFWKRHLTNTDEDTFYSSYQALTADYRPKGWTANLKDKASLSVCWVGYYCMVFLQVFVSLRVKLSTLQLTASMCSSFPH
jgi:hypothetical protein